MYALLLTALPYLVLPWPQDATTHATGVDMTLDPAAVLGQTPTGHDVGLFYYRPTVLAPKDIVHSLSPVHGRRTEYIDPSTGDDRSVVNLRSFGELLVIVDTLDRIELVLDTIEGLERETQTPRTTGTAKTLYYQPRYTSVDNLREALAPLVPTIAAFDDGSALVIHDNESSMQQIEALLAKLDQPAPQVVLSAWVLVGEHDENAPIPAELSKELRRMLPYEHYSQASIGLVRTAVKPGGLVKVYLRGQNSQFGLDLQMDAYDRETHALTFNSISFTENGHSRFKTSTTVEADRYTVLGAVGSPPLFIVLRISPEEVATPQDRFGGR